MDTFTTHFEAAIVKLKEKILLEFSSRVSELGFRSVWEHYEEVITSVLIDFLTSSPLNISESDIKTATSKSTYPDLKILFDSKSYAIDVKSGEQHKNPWYDIGRLDTYEEKHLEKYAGEYCITVQWKNHGSPKVLDIFIEPTYKSVGYRPSYDGVLYRPYDGKLRPKSWSDFQKGYSHWENLEHFKKGLKAAKIHRQMNLILNWYKNMDLHNRQKVKEILSAVDNNTTSDESNELLKSLDFSSDIPDTDTD